LNNNTTKQISKTKKPKADPSIEPIFPDFTPELSKIESKKKSKDRKAGFLVDTRKIYPPFKRDRDNFFLCDYPNPDTGKPCNLFFGAEKSINAHYSRVHNKDQNPNRLRRLEKEGKIMEGILKVTPGPFEPNETTKQATLLEFELS
jgi:hypothetical protein